MERLCLAEQVQHELFIVSYGFLCFLFDLFFAMCNFSCNLRHGFNIDVLVLM